MSFVTDLQTLINETRSMSGLGSNDYFEDTDIIVFLQDALRELDDEFTASNRHWRSQSYEFHVTNDAPTLNLAFNVPDLQVVQGVSDLQNPRRPRTVDHLGTFADRNNATYTKAYFEDGNNLVIYGRNVEGCYLVHYTPQSVQLALRESASWDIGSEAEMVNHERLIPITEPEDGCDTDEVVDHIDGASATLYMNAGSFGDDDVGVVVLISTAVQNTTRAIVTVLSPTTVVLDAPLLDDPLDQEDDAISILDVSNFSFPGAEFTDDMIGGEITITFTDGFNDAQNGTYFIYDVDPDDPTWVQIRLSSFVSLTGTPAGTISVTWQPPDTVDELPVLFRQWGMYLKLHASIAIREAQELDTTALERKLAAQKARIKTMSHKRSDGVIQPPVSRHIRRGWLGTSY